MHGRIAAITISLSRPVSSLSHALILLPPFCFLSLLLLIPLRGTRGENGTASGEGGGVGG